MKRLAIGILAHVDSGKTTLSEALLYRAGEIRKLGRVDHGDAFLDTHDLERKRGITIFSKQAVLRTHAAEYYLLDTPGHVDFSTEMERTLQALDYAVLVVSGTDGVQSHTETLWRLLAHSQIPTFLFINKMDLAGADRASLMADLRRLDGNCIDFDPAQQDGAFWESLAMCSEDLMEEILENGSARPETIAGAVARRQVFPCFFGSALRVQGVDELLDGLDQYTQPPVWGPEFGAKVFKISTDDSGNRLTHLKITGGSLKVRTVLSGQLPEGGGWQEKVNQIRIYSGAKFQAVEEAFPGMACAVTGLTKTFPGQGLGAEPDSGQPVLQPVLTYRVDPPARTNIHTLLTRLRMLAEEEPQLHVTWNETLQEIHVQLMGEVQLEILKSLLRDRFHIEAEFGEGNIIYKETITQPAEGIGHFEPLRHYAEVHLLLEPGKRDSGLKFATACREDQLDRNWQRLILTHLMEKTHAGVLTGAPITDMKITLIAGRAHLKHTEGGDFRQATYRAVRQGLRSTESILLEPWYTFRLELPAENMGRAMADLQRMNGVFDLPQQLGETSVLTGTCPVSTMQGYQRELSNYTHGKGRLSCTVKGYEPCHSADEVIENSHYDVNADLENTADSVFCSHGSGFLVRWDEVPQYAHIAPLKQRDQDLADPAQPAQTEKSIPDQEDQSPEARTARYVAMVAEDKELMAIFERTYGPIRRSPQTAMRTIRHPTPKASGRAPKLPDGPEYLLVDGYNIIYAWEDLKEIARDNLDAARSRLIHMLCNYQGVRRCEVILVFDAYKVKGNPGTVERFHNINVVYTKEAETADMYIEKVTHQIGKKHRVRVATSDGLEQLIIFGQGALRVSAKSFREEVDLVEKEIREFLDSQQQ